MKKYNIAVLGVSGVVGQQMLQSLEEQNIPVEKLLPLASSRSAGKTINFKGQQITIQEAKEDSFEGMDFVLGAVENDMAKHFAPYIKKAGAVFIDNSSAFRMDKDVPLVVPEINGSDAFKHNGIIANPNCSTIITLMAVAPIAKLSPIESMFASTYQAVSGAGQGGLFELEDQVQAYVNKTPIEKRVFPRQIALNVIPWIGSDSGNGFTKEEMKLQNEGRKILHLPSMNVSCTCVRVPVMRSHSIAVTIKTKERVTPQQAMEAIRYFPGCELSEDYPTPLETSGSDIIVVGRIREDANGLSLFCSGDQIRKGAASNAVQILGLLTK